MSQPAGARLPADRPVERADVPRGADTAGSSPPRPVAPPRAYLSIGQVLAQLRVDFPDVTLSKIRFLEAEGLVEPQRTASGYRQFTRDDVGRLRYVLAAQRDHYLPLRVIKDNLAALDRGLAPAAPGESGPPTPRTAQVGMALPNADDFIPPPTELRLARGELVAAAGLAESQLAALEQYGLVVARPGGFFDSAALSVATTVAALARFGIEARHLRPFKAAADREVGLVEQVIAPLARQRNPEARTRAEESARELAALSVSLHAALVKAGLAPMLGH